MIAMKHTRFRLQWPMLLVLAIAYIGPVYGAGNPNIFSAKVPIEDNSPDTREAGFKDAISRVLIRLTGSRSAASDGAVVDIIDSAASYVQGYRQIRDDGKTLMRVDFDPNALEQALAQSGLSVWGRQRPTVLIWLAVDNRNGERFLITTDQDNSLSKRIKTVAEDRGLPIILPLFDTEDRSLISFADIWGGFNEAVDAASARYAADAVLVGRARSRGRNWEVRWSLNDGVQRQQWVGSFADGIHHTADAFAQAFSIAEAAAGEALLSVEGVASFSDYGRIIEHLNKLSIVEHVGLEEATNDALKFRLVLRGDVSVLQRAVSLGGLLRPLSQEVPSNQIGPIVLRYQYRP